MPIPLRSDYDQARVRVAARESKNANQVRRLLALAAIYDGASRAEAAESAPGSEKVSKYRVAAADVAALVALLARLKAQAERYCGRTMYSPHA